MHAHARPAQHVALNKKELCNGADADFGFWPVQVGVYVGRVQHNVAYDFYAPVSIIINPTQ